jgi:hypothetical protein
MDKQKKKKVLKTKYPPIPKEFKELMADDFWLGNAHTLIELVAKERKLINSELSQDSIVEELAFYRLAFRLEVVQVKSKAKANQEKRMIALSERDQRAEVLFLDAVRILKKSNERVTYKSLVRELERMNSSTQEFLVYSDEEADKKSTIVSATFLKNRLARFNSSSK